MVKYILDGKQAVFFNLVVGRQDLKVKKPVVELVHWARIQIFAVLIPGHTDNDPTQDQDQ
jgi:hypothetical protein